jgi:hypothetical protein
VIQLIRIPTPHHVQHSIKKLFWLLGLKITFHQPSCHPKNRLRQLWHLAHLRVLRKYLSPPPLRLHQQTRRATLKVALQNSLKKSSLYQLFLYARHKLLPPPSSIYLFHHLAHPTPFQRNPNINAPFAAKHLIDAISSSKPPRIPCLCSMQIDV